MSKNPVTFTISLLQLSFAVGVQALVVAVAVGGLFSRVEAMEAAVAPLSRGDIVRLDERVQHMQGDIAWIRAQLEKDRER